MIVDISQSRYWTIPMFTKLNLGMMSFVTRNSGCLSLPSVRTPHRAMGSTSPSSVPWLSQNGAPCEQPMPKHCWSFFSDLWFATTLDAKFITGKDLPTDASVATGNQPIGRDSWLGYWLSILLSCEINRQITMSSQWYTPHTKRGGGKQG